MINNIMPHQQEDPPKRTAMPPFLKAAGYGAGAFSGACIVSAVSVGELPFFMIAAAPATLVFIMLMAKEMALGIGSGMARRGIYFPQPKPEEMRALAAHEPLPIRQEQIFKGMKFR